MNKKIDTILFDLDGTIYSKGKAIKTSPDMIRKMRATGYKLGFVTNTDGWPTTYIHNKFVIFIIS